MVSNLLVCAHACVLNVSGHYRSAQHPDHIETVPRRHVPRHETGVLDWLTTSLRDLTRGVVAPAAKVGYRQGSSQGGL